MFFFFDIINVSSRKRGREFMEQLIELITNNGISVICVAYLIYFQSTQMTKVTDTLTEIQKNLVSIYERLNDIEKAKSK